MSNPLRKRSNEESVGSHEPSRNPYEHCVLSEVFPSEPADGGEGGSLVGLPAYSSGGMLGRPFPLFKAAGEDFKHGSFLHLPSRLGAQHGANSRVGRAEIPPLDQGPLATESDKETPASPQRHPVHEYNQSKGKPKNGIAHAGARRAHRCEICGKVYKKSHNLKSHMRKHVPLCRRSCRRERSPTPVPCVERSSAKRATSTPTCAPTPAKSPSRARTARRNSLRRPT